MIVAVTGLLFQLTLSLPLDRLKVPTVEGQALTIHLSGNVDIALQDDGARVATSLRLDLSELQQQFPSIVRARSLAGPCEYRIGITAASIRADGGEAVVAATANGEVWHCKAGKEPVLLTTDTGIVRFRIRITTTPDQWIAFSVTSPGTEGPDRLRNALARTLAGAELAAHSRRALAASLMPETLVAPLPEPLRAMRLRVRSARLVEAEQPSIVLEIEADLVVPQDKLPALLAWVMGGSS